VGTFSPDAAQTTVRALNCSAGSFVGNRVKLIGVLFNMYDMQGVGSLDREHFVRATWIEELPVYECANGIVEVEGVVQAREGGDGPRYYLEILAARRPTSRAVRAAASGNDAGTPDSTTRDGGEPEGSE
jgi:hypothetical protein